MDVGRAARILGVTTTASSDQIRQAFLTRIRQHHPDVAGGDDHRAVEVIEAYRSLLAEGRTPAAPASGMHQQQLVVAVKVQRLDEDSVAVTAPMDETYGLLLEAAHDVGEITYLDRSGPIVEVLCSFVGEPATSLMLTLQGRSSFTEVFCTVESIEARPPPPTGAVVDLLEDALRLRANSPGGIQRG